MDTVSAACCLLAFLLYYNTLDAGFVYDDRRAILSNPDLLPSTPWLNLLENDFWGTPLSDSGSHGSYRPLCVFTFRLNYLLGGFQPWGYHLVNVLLHCLATVLVVRVARALLPPAKTKLGSAIAGLTFASHPIHSEAVAGVVGRADLAACNFYLMSFLVYVAHVKYRDQSGYSLSLNVPVNSCCVARCCSRISGVSQVKKTYRKPTRKTANGTANGHAVPNGYTSDTDMLSETKRSFLYDKRLNYHNILFHIINNIKQCNWFGKIEELSAASGVLCAVKFFFTCGINTWHLDNKCQSINNNNSNNANLNGDANCQVDGKCNGVVNNGVVSNGVGNVILGNGSLSNGSAHGTSVYNNGPVNGAVRCSEEECRLGAEGGCSRGRRAGGWRRHATLAACVLLATAATLSKETGVTALAACALYDLVRATQDATWNNKRRLASLAVLLGALLGLLAARVPLSAAPKFARADNPAAREPSALTRLLTFYYLPVFNFLLLVCPSTLSFDWSMDAIPRISSIFDPRNILTISFYLAMSKVLWRSARALYKQGENKTKQNVNSSRKDNKNHSYVYPKNGSNGRCAKINRNGLIYQLNGLCGYTSVVKSGKVLVSAGRMNAKTMCPCSSCRHALTDHHSTSCRAVNNNNSMTQHSTCTCSPPVSYASIRPAPEKPKPHRKSSHSALLLATSFLTLPFLPATNLFFYVGFVVAERVLYLPSVGFSLLLGLGGAKVGARLGTRARAAALGALLIALSARTLARNRDWRDEESLYRSAVGVNPPKAFGNLGSVLSSLGRLQEAEVAFHEALRHRPNMADVHYNLGVLLQGRSQYAAAVQSFERAIHFRPSLALAYVNMGASLSGLGRCAEAAAALARGARIDGAGLRDARAHASARLAALQALGQLHAAQRRPRRALLAYRQALQDRPPDYAPQKLYLLMSDALERLQRWAEAARYRRAAMQADRTPHQRPARGRVKAEAAYRRALRVAWAGRAGHIYGELVLRRGRSVRRGREEQARQTYRRFRAATLGATAADLLVAHCRTSTTTSPKSCCT